MSRRAIIVGIILSGLSPAIARPQGVEIDHKAVGCIVVGKFPKMNACFTPAAQLARGRVYFRPEGTPSWYYVEMKTDQPCYTGILPKPGKKLVGKKIEYYVEGQDRTFNAARTAEYGPVVVRSAQECKKEVPVAPFVNNATVAVFPSVPAGFAAGGAIGTAAAVAVAGAGVAAGTAAIVASGGNGNTTTTTVPSGSVTTTTVAAATTTSTSTTTTTVVSANHPPLAALKTNPDPPQGIGPLKVIFDMCASTDPDGDPLSFFFTFGDGAQASGACSQSHTYPASTSLRGSGAGGPRALDTSYGFQGCAVDPGSLSQCRTRTVVVKASPPTCGTTTANIDSPAPNACFNAPIGGGPTIPVTVTAMFATKVHFAADKYDCFSGFLIASDFVTADVANSGSDTYSTTFSLPDTTECFKIRATATSCGKGTVDATPVYPVKVACSDCTCPFSLSEPDGVRRTAAWSSDLSVESGRLQLIVNGASASFPARGRAYGVASLVEGENRVEAVLVESAGKAGLWRFDLMNSQAVVPGSLRVIAGEVVSIASSSVTFRLRGESGERIVFMFQKQ